MRRVAYSWGYITDSAKDVQVGCYSECHAARQSSDNREDDCLAA